MAFTMVQLFFQNKSEIQRKLLATYLLLCKQLNSEQAGQLHKLTTTGIMSMLALLSTGRTVT